MNLERIEEIINLVKSNDVKKFKYKDFENEIELDFTEGNSSQGLSQTANVQSNEMTQTNNETQDTNNQTQDSSDDKEIKSSMVGTFFLQDSKELTDPQIKVGDKVIYSKYAGTEIKLEDIEYILVKYEDILAVVE